MKTKWKRTGRKTIAALTLTAMMAGLFPGMEWLTLKGSAEAYQPKRTITIESVSDINPTAHLVFPSEWQNSGILTVTGKIKIESMASLGPGAGFFVNNAAAVERASYKANTDGWVNLSIAVNYNEERLIFGGWYASGRMSIADLVVKKADVVRRRACLRGGRNDRAGRNQGNQVILHNCHFGLLCRRTGDAPVKAGTPPSAAGY